MMFGVVAIGRNEGDRLKLCLASVQDANKIIYVDSGSTDDSLIVAREAGAEIVNLNCGTAFTAARARNAGFRRILEADPNIEFVQFIDGDCELITSWPRTALTFLHLNPDVAAVAGRLRERFPFNSIYNWLCDVEWNLPPGRAESFGGIVMMRAQAFCTMGGYREEMIAGEEPELSVRLRQAGWQIWRLDAEMALHDAAISRFSQWWRRAMRGGYAYALGASLHGASPVYHKVQETRRAWSWGVCVPLATLIAWVIFGRWGMLVLAAYPLQIVRISLKYRGPFKARTTIAFFQTLAKFPEAIGQLMFIRDRLWRHKRQLIEHK